MCAIAKDEGPYLDEWIRYNLKLGFDAVYVYDNSDDGAALVDLAAAHPEGSVVVVPFPGHAMQLSAYWHFREAYGARHTWCAFIDVDEFVVLRRHDCVKDLLREHCGEGALALNWHMFGSGGETEYRAEPVRKRFTRRAARVDQHVKTIVRLGDMLHHIGPHHVALREGATQHDTSGRRFHGPFNPEGPDDVACIHHYFVKSRGEFARKIRRGRSDGNPDRCMREFEAHDVNEVEDASAWTFMPDE